MSTPPPIDLSTHGYHVQKWIGHWYHCIGDLYMARRNDATDHIIREIKHDLLDDTNEIVREVKFLRSFRHPNVLDCSGCFVDERSLYIITPSFPYGSITDIMEASYVTGLPEKVISSVVYQTLKALQYVHSKRIIHRGVRGSHLLVDFHGRVVLAGFRGALQLPDGRRSTSQFERNLTTMLPWLAPEIINQDLTGYNYKSDLYSLGCVVCELANNIVPFKEMVPLKMLYDKGMLQRNPKILDSSTCKNNPNISVREHRERFLSTYIHDFVTQCLIQNQYARPSATELLSDQFVRSKRRNCLKYLERALTLNDVQRESTRDPELVYVAPPAEAPEWDFF